jgi:hypothetical protein
MPKPFWNKCQIIVLFFFIVHKVYDCYKLKILTDYVVFGT